MNQSTTTSRTANLGLAFLPIGCEEGIYFMGCSPHSFLRVQKIQFPQRIIVNIETKTKPPAPEAKDDLKTLPLPEVEKKLDTSPDGLTQAEAQKRLAQYGPNELV